MEDIKAAEDIETYATDLGKHRESIMSYKERLEKETNSIEEAWSGSDAARYIAKLRDDYIFLMDKLAEGLEKYVEHLEKVYPKYKEVDEEYQGRSIEV